MGLDQEYILVKVLEYAILTNCYKNIKYILIKSVITIIGMSKILVYTTNIYIYFSCASLSTKTNRKLRNY